MGLTLSEMLSKEYFRDFKVLAGRKGLGKQIQGIAVLDAPDGYQWTRGREFIISSGYVFAENPGLFDEFVSSPNFAIASGMGIKLGRFIQEVPPHIVERFEAMDMPLIAIPPSPSWMDIMYQLNSLVMNKNIRQFRIGHIAPRSFSNLSYQARKINKILSEMEKEMHFPAMLYDLASEKPYYSSPEFLTLMDDLPIRELWQPERPVTVEVLCDSLKMVRYRFHDQKYDKPYSWICVPITVEDVTRAYFVVVEATGLIDYFDQFALRIGFLLLQAIYEQILVAQSIGDTGFEKFVCDIISGTLKNETALAKRAQEIGLDPEASYFALLMCPKEDNAHLLQYKDQFREIVNSSIANVSARMAMVDDHSCLFLLPRDPAKNQAQNLEAIAESVQTYSKRIRSQMKEVEMVFALSDREEGLAQLRRSYERCLQAYKIGKLLFPDKDYLLYSDLGAFAWLQVQEDELDLIAKDLQALKNSPRCEEHLPILKAYLENKMNFSLTARQLFMHINTVRKKIEEINDLLCFDLEDPLNRLKLEILLLFIS